MNDAGVPSAGRMNIIHMAIMVAVAAVLFAAQDVFLPLAIAMLITFALSPLVTFLRRRGMPLMATVLVVVAITFVVMAAFALVVVSQLGELAQNLPTFQANIIAKVESLKQASGGTGIAGRLSDMISTINARIGAALPGDGKTPIPVEVVQSTNAMDFLESLVIPLISPIATTGLVGVLVVFMLLEREHLRDRFIRLVGSSDLFRTTQVLEEAGSRVGKYLLIQLLVNVIYAMPIGVGLFVIGVPNAVLWGLLTLILRFVPYIGSVLSAAFPLFLAFAVSPAWAAVLWTAALFAVVELVTSNAVEPWLYGSRTGVSPLAIIVAAIFWTFLWGPLGLVLSTPLTVCLVVLGRHIPQFAIFDILFGDEPVLASHTKLYQRLLVGDGLEATLGAHDALESVDLVEYYETTLIPALLLAQYDRDRGLLNDMQEARLADVAMTMVADLSTETDSDANRDPAQPGAGLRIAVVGGRSSIDDVAARIMAQAVQLEGAQTTSYPHQDLAPSRIADLTLAETDCLMLTFLDPAPSRTSLLHIRRLKRAAPALRVGAVILQSATISNRAEDHGRLQPVSAETLDLAKEMGADFAVTNLDDALQAACDRSAPVAAPALVKPLKRPKSRVALKPKT